MTMELEFRIALLAERAAAEVQDGMTLGLGSGSTAEAVVRELGRRVRGGLRVIAVATSTNTARLAAREGISLLPLDEVDHLDLGIDGADEIDPDLNLVKGRGGALLYEKLVARVCDRFVIASASEKLVSQLGTRMPLPVEVVPMGWRHTRASLVALGCEPALRMAGDQPFLTDGGHYILDCDTGPIHDPVSFAFAVKETTGVVDHGLFIGMADAAITIDPDGAIVMHQPSGATEHS